MDTQFLHTFVAVVDHGSMAAAARLLNITAAAVAQQIHTLEREIGVPLIARAGRTVSVTEPGSRILQRARRGGAAARRRSSTARWWTTTPPRWWPPAWPRRCSSASARASGRRSACRCCAAH